MIIGLALLLATLLQTHNRAEVGMGFDQEKTVHHFALTADGGYIDVAVRDAKDSANREAIRMHLQHIAVMFKAGDFSIPMFVHDEKPAGVDTMKELAREITYHYSQTAQGARVTVRTKNAAARKAIHEFLRYQIREHHTG